MNEMCPSAESGAFAPAGPRSCGAYHRAVADVRECAQCGTPFTPQREHARFCSPRCRMAWNREHAGVAAAPVYDEADAYADPHFEQRQVFRPVTHPSAGTHLYPSFGARFSGMEPEWGRPAPLIGQDLRVKTSAGAQVTAPVGSVAVREAIEEVQPLLGLHGHIHESGGSVKIGRTTAINVGSEYGEGVLRGVLLTIGDGKLLRYQAVTG